MRISVPVFREDSEPLSVKGDKTAQNIAIRHNYINRYGETKHSDAAWSRPLSGPPCPSRSLRVAGAQAAITGRGGAAGARSKQPQPPGGLAFGGTVSVCVCVKERYAARAESS